MDFLFKTILIDFSFTFVFVYSFQHLLKGRLRRDFVGPVAGFAKLLIIVAGRYPKDGN